MTQFSNPSSSAEESRLFQVTAERGFLPAADPVLRLPPAFDAWEQIAGQLPKLLVADQARRTLHGLPVLDSAQCGREEDLHRAMLLLSYFAHACVWGSAEPAHRIPAGVAIPWHRISQRLGRPPVLSYASYALYNWRRLDAAGPIALGNIVLCQNFLGGIDEEWFVLVHVEIEAIAAAAIGAIGRAQPCVAEDRPADLTGELEGIATALQKMLATLGRMTEHCDPYIYYHRVRPYLYGWKDQPALPDGLIYEGVGEYQNQPRKFRGETGAQSSIIPSLDAALGISHAGDPLRVFLTEMREYMPPSHREMIATIECGPAIRPYVLAHRAAHPGLRDAYNACVQLVQQFRSKHLEYAARYIQQQSQRDRANPTAIGTGGTPFIPYLRKHRDETAGHLID